MRKSNRVSFFRLGSSTNSITLILIHKYSAYNSNLVIFVLFGVHQSQILCLWIDVHYLLGYWITILNTGQISSVFQNTIKGVFRLPGYLLSFSLISHQKNSLLYVTQVCNHIGKHVCVAHSQNERSLSNKCHLSDDSQG